MRSSKTSAILGATLRLALLFFLVISSGVALAQDLTGGIVEGAVFDQEGLPVAGVTVSAAGPQGSRLTKTDARGRYVLRALAPGYYRVRAEGSGLVPAAESDVRVGIAGRTQVRFRLYPDRAAAGSSAETTLLDRKSTTTGSRFVVAEAAPYIPVGRNLASVYTLSPGVSDGGNLGFTNSSISGASGLENGYLIDGVNIVSSGYGALGTYSPVYDSLGTGITRGLLEEVQVMTGGLDAELGQAMGGVVNTVVRAGSNDFVFDISWYETPESLEGARRDRLDAPNIANLVEASRREIAVTVGGPAVREKLYYFAGYNPVEIEESFKLTSGDENRSYDLDGDGLSEDFFEVGETISGGRVPGVVTRKRTVDNYAAKLSWFPTPDHKLELAAFGDPSEGRLGPQQPTVYLRNLADPVSFPDPNTGTKALEWGGDQLVLQYQGVWTPRFFTEVRLSRRASDLSEILPEEGPRFFDNDNGVQFGAGPSYERLTDESKAIAFKNTHVLGPVELSYGYQRNTIEWAQPRLTSGPRYLAYFPNLIRDGAGQTGFAAGCGDPAAVPPDPRCYTALRSADGAAIDVTGLATATPADDRYYVRASLTDPTRPTEATEQSLFVQAVWEVSPGVTLKAGLRSTELELTGAGDETLPIGLLQGGTVVGGIQTAIRGQAYAFDTELAPRIGVAWDVRNDGRHSVFAHVGDYYQRVPSSLAAIAFSSSAGVGESFADIDLTIPSLDGSCGFDTDGDGLFESTVACHRPSAFGLSAADTTVLDGTQLDPGSQVYAALGPWTNAVGGAATKLPYTREALLGYGWQIDEATTLEARYITRSLKRMIHDVQFASVEQFSNQVIGESGGSDSFGDPFPGHGSAPFGTYALANVGVNVDSRMFPKPKRDYDALEIVLNRRFADGWMGRLDYRLSRLEGNYEGAYRNDNGSSQSALCSVFDFPAASAVDTDGDASFDAFIPSATIAGQYVSGPLNTERRHVLDVFGSRQFAFGLNVGGRLRIQSGQPKGEIYAHPAYGNAGEVPAANPVYWWGVDVDTTGDGLADGTGFFTDTDATRPAPVGDPITVTLNDGTMLDGTIVAAGTSSGFARGPRLFAYDVVQRDSRGRTPTLVTLDLGASYDVRLRGGKSDLTFLLDLFNVLDDGDVMLYDNNVELRPGSPNPDFGEARAFQAPRTVRLGLHFRW